jgi:hypothetical protein
LRAPAPVAYTPTTVETETLVQQGIVLAGTTLPALFWWRVTVPEKRLEISRSKKSGELKEVLDDLAEKNAAGSPTSGEKRVERWLLTDWLRNEKRKEPALPFLPRSKFNSGDNPILAAGLLIVLTGVVSATVKQVFG